MASSDPRTATEEQWEDLIDKVKGKADLVDVPTIQMTTTDPGEGAPLADGHFIAVYGGSTQVGTSDIADGAVTTAKINNSAVTTAKIADTNVTTGKIANGAVTSAKMDWATVINNIYPVGSIFMSVSHKTAAAVKSALGNVGTWVAWGSGRVPVGVNTSDSSFNTVEKTGGEKTHTLTVSEMPSHSHNLGYGANVSSGNISNPNFGSGTSAASTSSTGSGGAHNNLQPYITCYMYKRTA